VRVRSSVAIVVMLGACGSGAPRGALEARWGDDVSQVASRLGVQCTPFPDGEFERCTGGPIVAFDRHPAVTLVGEHGRLAAVTLRFERAECDHVALQRAIGKEFGVTYTPGEAASPYTVFSDHELVYFNDCQLVVAGSHYGEHFVDDLLSGGFRGLVNAMQPH
jgi:hypothetical protein